MKTDIEYLTLLEKDLREAAKREDFWKTPTAGQDLWSDVLDLFQV